MLFYTGLLAVELYLMLKYIRLGPSSLGTGRYQLRNADDAGRGDRMIYLFDYATLKLIWWLLVGALLVGFAILDGFDLGVGTLLPFVARTDTERRVALNTVGPTWEGNQVWFITAGGATFAAWPLVYATAFSGFYVALILTLFALFFRPVGFDYRSKVEDPRWRTVLGLGNLRRRHRAGAGLRRRVRQPAARRAVSFRRGAARVLHRQLRRDAESVRPARGCRQRRDAGDARRVVPRASHRGRRCRSARAAPGASPRLIFVVAFAAGGVFIATAIDGYRITAMPPANASFVPLAKTVVRAHGAWLDNYSLHPWTLLAPLAAFAGALLAQLASARRHAGLAFVLSSIAVAGVVLTAGFALFPFIMPSSSDPASSLTVWDAVSSRRTLQVMFWGTLIFLPIVLAYTAWAYHVTRGKVTERHVREGGHGLY